MARPAWLVHGYYSSDGHLSFAGRFAPSRYRRERMPALYDPTSHGSLVRQAGTHTQVVARASLGIILAGELQRSGDVAGSPQQSRGKSAGGIAGVSFQCDGWQDHTSVGVGCRHADPTLLRPDNKSRGVEAPHSGNGGPVGSCFGCRCADGRANSFAPCCRFDRKRDPHFGQHRDAQIEGAEQE